MRELITGAPKVRHDRCRPFGPLVYRELGFPALAGWAINFRSFGPKTYGTFWTVIVIVNNLV